MKVLIDYIRMEIMYRREMRKQEKLSMESMQNIEELSEEELNEKMEELRAYIRAHDQRMKTDPAYAKQWRQEMRSLDIFMFFHDPWLRKCMIRSSLRAVKRLLIG